MTPTDLLWIAVAVGVPLFLYSRARGKLSSADARALVSSGATLIDVRSRAEFASGHLERARNIPIDELDSRLKEVGGKEQPVILYCASGMRSALGTRRLRRSGFTQVHNLGAMSRW